MERNVFDPMAYFQIGEGTISLTGEGQQFAGNSANSAHARGNLLADIAVRIMNRIEFNTNPASDASKSDFLYRTVRADAANAAQPPLSLAEKEDFMAGARQVLEGAES